MTKARVTSLSMEVRDMIRHSYKMPKIIIISLFFFASFVFSLVIAVSPVFPLETASNWTKTQFFADNMFEPEIPGAGDRKSTRLNSSHGYISYAVFCLKKKLR